MDPAQSYQIKGFQMMNEQIAVISDVHGNSWALQEVLRDIQRRTIEKIVNLGDCLYGPLDPAGTADILIDLNIPTARGNEDRIIYQPTDGDESNPTLTFVRSQLNRVRLEWLKSLPKTAVIFDTLFLCHGTPDKDDEYLLRVVQETGVVLRDIQELQKIAHSAGQPVLLCGHDHKPGATELPDGRLIANPGSVGLQAYDDDHPLFHIIENDTPHARYSILSNSGTGWIVENVTVEYDWQTASSVALKNGRPDWARWLLTGRATIA